MAGRPRDPLAVSVAKGVDYKNGKRLKERADPATEPLGSPPRTFSEPLKDIWNEYREEIPWLSRADRMLVNMACRLREQVESGEAPVNVYAQLRMMLSSMGATPVDRTKVSAPQEPEGEDPAAKYFN